MNQARSIANKNLWEIADKIKKLDFQIEDIKNIYNLAGQPASPNWSGTPSGKGGVSDVTALSVVQRDALSDKILALKKQQEDLKKVFCALVSDCNAEEEALLRAIIFDRKVLPDYAAEKQNSVSYYQNVLGSARDKVYLRLTAIKSEDGK